MSAEDDYWSECIGDAAEACGLELTAEQRKGLVKSVQVAHEDYGMAFYSPPSSDRLDSINSEWEAKWKKRALEAEALNRKFVAAINGSAYMGEPAQPAPSALAEAIIADMQAQHDSELITENDSGEALIRLDGAIAAVEDNFALAQPAPSIPEGWKLVPTAESRHPGIYKMLSALHAVDNTPGASEWESYAAMLAAAPEAKP